MGFQQPICARSCKLQPSEGIAFQAVAKFEIVLSSFDDLRPSLSTIVLCHISGRLFIIRGVAMARLASTGTLQTLHCLD